MQELRENKTCCAMYVSIVVAVLASAIGAGCQQLGGWPSTSSSSQPSYKQAYGPTPKQRIEALQQLASRAGNLTPNELLTTGGELTQTFKTERDPHIRRAIVQTLAVMPGNFSEEALHLAMEDPVASVRCAACNAWASRPEGSPAMAVLHERLSMDQDPDVRLSAIEALAGFDSQQTIPLLGAALEHRDPAIKFSAMDAMRRVSGKDLGESVDAWRQFAASQIQNIPAANNPIQLPAALPQTSEASQIAGSAISTAIQAVSGQTTGTVGRDDGDFVR